MMLEEIYQDNLIGDPNDLDEIIEQQGDRQFGEAEEEDRGSEDGVNDATADNENPDGTRVEPRKKQVIRNPRPKLGPEQLQSSRGIAVLENTFKDFKFRGKGYEKFDLDRVMKRLEHWAHRLSPRFQFDDCLERIEKLGQNKNVQVYVKKIRMGLETADVPVELVDEDDEPEVHYEAPVDDFDELLSQQLSRVGQESRTQFPSSQTLPPPHQSAVSQSADMTAEQRQRMLRNQLLAKEKRLARMKANQELQETAETERTATSVSNIEAGTSFELPSPKINGGTSDTVDVQDANTCENEETTLFCEAFEVGGTSAISKSVDTDNLKIISGPTDKVSNFSKPTEPADAERIDGTSMTVDAERIDGTSMPGDAERIDGTSMPGDAEGIDDTSMPVDAERIDGTSMPGDAEGIDDTSMPVDAERIDGTSMPMDAEETRATPTPVGVETNIFIHG
ncbi:TIMELESS-interacting protein isoform X3 [Zootermopsis nevadensis]|uniref:TIMELESS-interacting protein isoform X3 n=1 Tax=Zootermopsis nevadensis TaxID=136037 RepID=UPI000B8E39FF|nr:TIMELESS-interacting protein isoform X3 [Zootermopsis nevadensis]